MKTKTWIGVYSFIFSFSLFILCLDSLLVWAHGNTNRWTLTVDWIVWLVTEMADGLLFIMEMLRTQVKHWKSRIQGLKAAGCLFPSITATKQIIAWKLSDFILRNASDASLLFSPHSLACSLSSFCTKSRTPLQWIQCSSCRLIIEQNCKRSLFLGS